MQIAGRSGIAGSARNAARLVVVLASCATTHSGEVVRAVVGSAGAPS